MSRNTTPQSRFTRQLDRGFRWLRFEQEIETDFRTAYAVKTYLRTMVGLFLGLVMTFVFVAIDLAGNAYLRGSPAVSFISLLIVPGLMVCIVIGFHPRWRRYVSQASGLLIGGIGIGIVLITVESRRVGGHFPYEVLMNLAIYTYFLTGLTFYRALLCGAVAVGAYAAAGAAGAYVKPEFFYDLFFVISIYLLGGWGCYISEFAERRDFLQRRILNELAQVDALTSVPNRRSLEQHLAKVWREAPRTDVWVAVVMVDIDHFKAYNDRYGHPAGDDTLRAVAEMLATHFRRPLDMLARYGGEEFSGVWYNIEPKHVDARVEALRAAVESLAIMNEGSSVNRHVTVSIGVMILQPDPRTGGPPTAIKQADQALYRAKKAGRNRAEVVVREARQESHQEPETTPEPEHE